jgi:hypothetical protein
MINVKHFVEWKLVEETDKLGLDLFDPEDGVGMFLRNVG